MMNIAMSKRSLFYRMDRVQTICDYQWSAETVLFEGTDLSVHSQAYLNKLAR